MKRWFVVTATVVLVLNVGVLVFSEIRTRQLMASLSRETIETHSHSPVVRRYVLPTHAAPAISADTDNFYSSADTNEIISDSTEDEELFDMLQETLDDVDEECCPEDDALLTDDWGSLSWTERVRQYLTSKHGDIPEIPRYIELTSVYRDGGSLTVAEVLEHLELKVFLYPGSSASQELAQAREISKNYSPDDQVKVSRSYGGDPTPKTGTTVTETVHHPDE